MGPEGTQANPVVSTPIGRIPTEDQSAAPLVPTLNPSDSPYTPLELPTVEPKQIPVPEASPEPQNLGAVNHAGAIAYVADKILRGALQGYDFAQAHKAEQYNKKLSAQQQVYNDQARQLHAMAVAGVDPNSQEFKDARNRVLASWQATMQTIGERIPQPKKSKKSQQGQASGVDQSNLIQRVANHKNDPQDALQAVYQGAIATGPPVFHQIAPYLTPQYQQQQRMKAQAQGTQNDKEVLTSQRQHRIEELEGIAHRTPEQQQELESLRGEDKNKNSWRPLDKTPYLNKSTGKYEQRMYNEQSGATRIEVLDNYTPPAPKAALSEWAQGLKAFAESNKLDPNDWKTIRLYNQERFSSKNPLADRRLALAQRNSDINAASLDLRKSANDFNDMEKIFKQIGPDVKIQATAKAVDDYTKSPTGPGDVALTLAFFEVAKAADPGSGSGIRFTQQEQKLISSARGWADAAKANVQRWGKGTLYDDAQRKEMADLIKKAAARSNEATIDYMTGAQKLNPRAADAATASMHQGAPAPVGGKVKMKAPNGSVGYVPANQVEHYESLGAVVVK